MRRGILLFTIFFLSGCVSLVGPNDYSVKVKKEVISEASKRRKLRKKETVSDSKLKADRKIGCKSTYKVWGKEYCVLKHSYGFEEIGIASWYGPNFHGKKTASGEVYNMYEMTAAHKSLPLGTYVKVINLENGKSVVVKINDRGPFVPGRIIDLSYAAAKKLGVVAKGTAKVKIVALGRKEDGHYTPENYERGSFYIQLGAFEKFENAEKLKNKFVKKGIKAKIIQAFGLFRVVVGPQLTYVKAMEERDRLRKIYPDAFVIRVN
ncbi:septal ring lytic transglycosylase RlpA family protein [Desulfurobacterium atlanticum]|uniref:Probable endolytic peptidoglycan transglycosylase RlpA n=1 Tax=Desulfurobacterium atlanticum TaxID=240169 RepID=A0A238ZJF5_9BACT|nr:septal ring lytic transglycosylase RlpA family protein [Desulfurobacterium atlanticum]SNR83181.1 rare lipoprotein A [Desulfurobacterium atlanticum]